MMNDNDTAYYAEEAATLGDRVVAAREAMGMTQKDLARQLGVKLKTVQGWEDDRTEPRANKAQMMSGVLGVSLSWLLSGEGAGVPEPVETPELGTDLSSALRDIRKLKVELSQSVRQLGAIEKRLRRVL
ncbi:transcriptional repressor DicA [Shimia thalassica]|uniref:Transcriptional repressor DicA n=2 Tax=Shimia thalassica TaxID=1715693 RepID=A0A0P1IJ23_9RHOB|nr:helix-turn-helix domain-containing protein [Shimia thalassica]CUK15869.1 transcriptional repressor DicA [Shimia thalassica]